MSTHRPKMYRSFHPYQHKQIYTVMCCSFCGKDIHRSTMNDHFDNCIDFSLLLLEYKLRHNFDYGTID